MPISPASKPPKPEPLFNIEKQEIYKELGVDEKSGNIGKKVFESVKNIEGHSPNHLKLLKDVKNLLKERQATKTDGIISKIWNFISGSKGRYDQRMKELNRLIVSEELILNNEVKTDADLNSLFNDLQEEYKILEFPINIKDKRKAYNKSQRAQEASISTHLNENLLQHQPLDIEAMGFPPSASNLIKQLYAAENFNTTDFEWNVRKSGLTNVVLGKNPEPEMDPQDVKKFEKQFIYSMLKECDKFIIRATEYLLKNDDEDIDNSKLEFMQVYLLRLKEVPEDIRYPKEKQKAWDNLRDSTITPNDTLILPPFIKHLMGFPVTEEVPNNKQIAAYLDKIPSTISQLDGIFPRR